MADTFVSVSFVADELLTSTKMNTVAANLSNFHNGTALGDGIIVSRHFATDSVPIGALQNGLITFAKLLSTIFSGQIQTVSNSGNAGGTMYYINLGGIKLLWGSTATATISSGGDRSSTTVTLPSGFFTTTHSALATTNGNGSAAYDVWIPSTVKSLSATTLSVGQHNFGAATSGSVGVFYLVIGV